QYLCPSWGGKAHAKGAEGEVDATLTGGDPHKTRKPPFDYRLAQGKTFSSPFAPSRETSPMTRDPVGGRQHRTPQRREGESPNPALVSG
ncbi:MAG: hypothetical protein ACO394_11155, partial [Blastocatellia bacterium]